MSSVGFGPVWRIDGPLPLRPTFGLVQAAESAAPGVTLVTDVDADQIPRWVNGVGVYPYPPGPAWVWNACAGGSESAKRSGAPFDIPEFVPMVVYLPETCTAVNVWTQGSFDEFKSRAVRALAAYEGAAVAHEFLTGQQLTLNPHLADGQGTFPAGNTATTPVEALALLEGEIAGSGGGGVIHVSPQMATVLGSAFAIFEDTKLKILRSTVGTLVVPDAGYHGGATPAGHTAATGRQEWMYATGPIEVRRTEPFVVPDKVSEALDRGAGGTPNGVTYRAERYYMVTWDTQVQAAVKADRCLTVCP